MGSPNIQLLPTNTDLDQLLHMKLKWVRSFNWFCLSGDRSLFLSDGYILSNATKAQVAVVLEDVVYSTVYTWAGISGFLSVNITIHLRQSLGMNKCLLTQMRRNFLQVRRLQAAALQVTDLIFQGLREAELDLSVYRKTARTNDLYIQWLHPRCI